MTSEAKISAKLGFFCKVWKRPLKNNCLPVHHLLKKTHFPADAKPANTVRI